MGLCDLRSCIAREQNFNMSEFSTFAKYVTSMAMPSFACVVTLGHHWLTGTPGVHQTIATGVDNQFTANDALRNEYGLDEHRGMM